MIADGSERIASRLLDILFSLIVFTPLFIWVFQITELKLLDYILPILIYGFFANLFLEFIIPLLTKGKTIGKAIMGLRMISDDYADASAGQLFIRSTIYTILPLFASIPFLGTLFNLGITTIEIISLVFIFTDIDHQAVHDKMANTIVIKE